MAINNQATVPRLEDVPLLQDLCAGNTGLCALEASGTMVHLPSVPADIGRQLNDPGRMPSIDRLTPGVPVVTFQQSHKTAEIPVVSKSAQPGARVRPARSPEPPNHVLLFNHRDGNGSDLACHSDLVDLWSSEPWLRSFRAAVSQARIRRDELSTRFDIPVVEVLILDGGFFDLRPAGSTAPLWPGFNHLRDHATLGSLNGMAEAVRDQIAHGTAVASIVAAGPGQTAVLADLDLAQKLSVRSIYRPLPGRGAQAAVLSDKLGTILNSSRASIINLSFGAQGETAFRLLWMKQNLNRNAPLFVMAAGNLGANNGLAGQSIRNMGLLPQGWATTEVETGGGGSNALVVTSVETRNGTVRRARHANFDDQLGIIGAPGCGIPALRIGADGGYETARFTGTSYAAPLVTWLASVVRGLMPETAHQSFWTRARLLASADHHPGISDRQIPWGRVINPLSAVRLYEDIVTLKGDDGGPGEVLAGQLDGLEYLVRPNLDEICDSGRSADHVMMRLFQRGADEASMFVDLVDPASGRFETVECAPNPEVVLTLHLPDGDSRAIRPTDVADILFSMPTSQEE